MFRPISDKGLARANVANAASPARLAFTFDGRPLSGCAGDSVAAALLRNGVTVFRQTPVSGAPRAPYCLMGVCFDCLVVIDGNGNRQSCLVPLREGMRIETQQGRGQIAQIAQITQIAQVRG